MSKFNMTDDERSCVEAALEMLVASYHEDNCSLEVTRARHMLKSFRPHAAEES